MDTALYYTFSTISQTFAGAIALLGAFTLYRLQQISSLIEDAAGTAIQAHINPMYNHRDVIQHFMANEQYQEIFDYINNNPVDTENYITALHNKLGQLLIYKKELLALLNRSLLLSVIIIGYSICVLPFVPQIVKCVNSSAPPIIIGIGFIGVILSLVTYAILIRKILSMANK